MMVRAVNWQRGAGLRDRLNPDGALRFIRADLREHRKRDHTPVQERLFSLDEEVPQTQCPRCGEWLDDLDGFGVLAHIPGCGYCSHPSGDGDGKGGYTCGICGVAIPSTRPVDLMEALRVSLTSPIEGSVNG